MSESNPDKKIVVVTGDVAMDWNLAHTRRCTSALALWQVCDTTKAYWQRGGSALLADLVSEIADEQHRKKRFCFSIRQPDVPHKQNMVDMCNPEFHHSYTMWSTFKNSKDATTGGKNPAWRVQQFLGLDRAAPNDAKAWEKVVNDTRFPDLIILDDAGLGFRDKEELWPKALRPPTNPPPWVILKMARPLAAGPLWDHLQRTCTDRLIVVATVEDLRLSTLQVSRALSWERTAQDIYWELVHNPHINALSQCAHVVISFGTDGALLLSRRGERAELTAEANRKGRDNEQAEDNATQNKKEAAKERLPFECFLFFDPVGIEGTWAQQYPGCMMGYTACLTAGVARAVMSEPENPDVAAGVYAGLAAMRKLHRDGYGEQTTSAAEAKLVFPLRAIAQVLASPAKEFFRTAVREPERYTPHADKPREHPVAGGCWTILEDSYPDPFYDLAAKVVLCGPKAALEKAPRAEFGRLITVDRQEIESFCGILNLIDEYCKKETQKQPLSVAVFGPPGAGKSFGIKQMANAILPDKIKELTFNLSQFDTEKDLHDAFHQVRDAGLQGKIPLVFWDEFDTSMSGTPLGWLRYFLSPMQDGEFQDGQITHPIGKSIFVFAGGTSKSMAAFDKEHGNDNEGKTSHKNDNEGKTDEQRKIEEDATAFKNVKGPDFISRLKGYINILGPNPVKGDVQSGADPYYIIRRAIIVRSNLEVLAPQIFTQRNGNNVPRIDEGVLRALLQIDCYYHGARSIESIITISQLTGKNCFERSDLPPESLLNLHVDGKRFLSLVQQLVLKGDLLEKLAQAAHNVFYDQHVALDYVWGPKTDEKERTHANLLPYDKLSEDIKEQNRGNVRDIPRKLESLGYVMVQARRGVPIFRFSDEEVETLAKAEHERWLRAKKAAGWTSGQETDPTKKQNKYMVEWDEESEEAKDKDRELVRNIPAILSLVGYTIAKVEQSDEGGNSAR